MPFIWDKSSDDPLHPKIIITHINILNGALDEVHKNAKLSVSEMNKQCLSDKIKMLTNKDMSNKEETVKKL
jgi:hypothetical protein